MVFHNGTTVDLVKVPAPLEYQELVLRLSQGSPPPRVQGLPFWKRWVKKKLGQPRTPDVEILGRFIEKLSQASSAALQGHRIDRISLALPLFPGLTHHDINEAIEYAGLRSWHVFEIPYPRVLSESRAAFGANGYGLCQYYKNIYECQEEWNDMPAQCVCILFRASNPSPTARTITHRTIHQFVTSCFVRQFGNIQECFWFHKRSQGLCPGPQGRTHQYDGVLIQRTVLGACPGPTRVRTTDSWLCPHENHSGW